MQLRKVFPEPTKKWPEKKTCWRRHLAVKFSVPSSHAGQAPDEFQAVVVHTVSGSHKTEKVDHSKMDKKKQWEQFKQDAVKSAVRDASELAARDNIVPLVPSSCCKATPVQLCAGSHSFSCRSALLLCQRC